MEESITGFICTGGWMDIVEHGERVTSALIAVNADDEYEDAFQRWESWRPKADERLSEDVNQKTADEASVTEGPGEKAGITPDDDLRKAGKRISESVDSQDTHEAYEKWCDSVMYTARAADSSWRKSLRSIEQFLYKHVMTTLSPYYFDTKLVKANITRKGGPKSHTYRFEVSIADDNQYGEVREQMHTYEDEIDRWHISTNKDTDRYTTIEGCESPEGGSKDDQSFNPTQNLGSDEFDTP